MSAELKAEVKRLSNLIQNKGIPLEDLESSARLNLIVRDFKSNPMFDIETDDGKKEQELAESRFKNYLENSELESASDIDTLKSLIFIEIYESRIQSKLNDQALDGKNINEKLIKSLVNVQNQKNTLKVKLGIDRKEDERDDLSAYQLLHKRVDNYIQNHKNEFSFNLGFQCEKCNHKNWDSFLLYKRIKDFDGQIKNPWFIGRFLCNYEILKDVKDGKITKEQAVRYHMCAGEGNFYAPSPADKTWCLDYINYLLENWKEITDMLNHA